MKECVCGERAYYSCRPCKAIVCKEHKIMHEKGKQRKHIFNRLGKKFTAQQLAKIGENLSLRIKIVNECRNTILEDSRRLLAKITRLSMHALDIINKKQKYYENLLILCQKRLFDDEIKEIELHLGSFLVTSIPNHEFKEIQEFYNADFFKEFQRINVISQNGENTILDISPLDLIENIKTKIEEKIGIPPCQQRFIFEGKQLENKWTLAYYNIQNDSTIHLIYLLQIFLRENKGEIITLYHEQSDTIENVRTILCSQDRIPSDRLTLNFEGNQLYHWRTLADYNIINKSTLLIVPWRREQLRIFVKALNRKIHTFEVTTGDFIKDIKGLIQAKKGIPPNQQKLILSLRQLEDGLTLADYGIKNESTIQLLPIDMKFKIFQ